MTNDIILALLTLAFLVSAISGQSFGQGLVESLLSLTRPGATVALLGIIAYLYIQKLIFTAIAFAVLSMLLLKDVWTNWPRSDARRLYLDISRDQARFEASNSIDLQFANGSVTHNKPKMLSHDKDVSPLLLFPPSSSTLEEMCGQ